MINLNETVYKAKNQYTKNSDSVNSSFLLSDKPVKRENKNMIRQTENPIEMSDNISVDNIPVAQEEQGGGAEEDEAAPLSQEAGKVINHASGVKKEFRIPEDEEFRISSSENEKFSIYAGFRKNLKKYRMLIISVVVITFFIVVDKYSLPPLVSSNNSSHTSNGTKNTNDSNIYSDEFGANKFNGAGHTGIALSGLKLLQYFDTNLDSISTKELNSEKSKNQKEDLTSQTNFVSSYYYDLFMSFLISNQNALSFEENKKTLVEILTRDVTPLNYVHSHNDYWRTLPVFDALMHGVNSIEADIWLNNSYVNHVSDDIDTDDESSNHKTMLAVGHNKDYLDPIHRNLENLYINPLQILLDEVNQMREKTTEKLNGLFHTDTGMPTILYIDFKQPELSETVYDILVNEYLGTPDFQKYLTYKDQETNQIVFNPLIIILTGDYPRYQDYKKYAEFVFLDLDIVELVQNNSQTATEIPPAIVVSTSLKKLLNHCQSEKNGNEKSVPLEIESFVEHHLVSLNEQELQCMTDSIGFVNALGLKTRIWGVPQYPVYLRNSYWKQLLIDMKSDYLNVDDLDGVLSF